MGVVYEAIQLPLNRRVALKVLFETATSDEKYYRRFVREAEIASRLHHTNIVPVFEAGQSEGCYFYAMQLIDGKNLLQLIQASDRSASERQSSPTLDVLATYEETARQSGNLTVANELPNNVAFRTPPSTKRIESPTVCAGWVLQVADGLHFAHQRGILHRDVKPSNIIVDREQRAWIADFGLAKAQEDAGLTEDHDVVGTSDILLRSDFKAGVISAATSMPWVLHSMKCSTKNRIGWQTVEPSWCNKSSIIGTERIIGGRTVALVIYSGLSKKLQLTNPIGGTHTQARWPRTSGDSWKVGL
jgi:serine/threonine protein kinase